MTFFSMLFLSVGQDCTGKFGQVLVTRFATVQVVVFFIVTVDKVESLILRIDRNKGLTVS
jgi:hypothetical protein